MGRRSNGELSKHPTKGYRVCVGTRESEGGKIVPAVFWLGHDLEAARFKAQFYRKIWNEPEPNADSNGPPLIPAHRGRHWNAETTRRANERIATGLAMLRCVFNRHDTEGQLIEPMRAVAMPFAAPSTVAKTSPSDCKRDVPAMMHAAVDEYVKAIEAKPLSVSYKRRVAETMGGLKERRHDVPLASIDRVWIETLTDEIKGRPLSRKKDKRSGKKEPIKPGTVKTLLQHWRQAFDWIDRASDSDRFGRWEAPKRMNDLFACDLNKLRTKAERDRAADGPEQITVAEIVKLYRSIDDDNDLHRITLLMGIFTAQGQAELACTRRDEFDLEGARFTHRRSKTGQRGCYWLPDELVKLLRSYFIDVKTNDGNLAFFTRDGNSLVTEKSDSVRQMFDDLRSRAKITRPGISFYSCRRFLADRAARKGGDSLRDTALAHSAKTVGGKHYSNFRDFAGLEQVSRELYVELTTAGLFSPASSDEQAVDREAATAAA